LTTCTRIIITWEELEGVDPRELWRRPLSTTQAAEELGIAPYTIRRWIEAGKLPARRIGRNYQIPRAAVRMVSRQHLQCPD